VVGEEDNRLSKPFFSYEFSGLKSKSLKRRSDQRYAHFSIIGMYISQSVCLSEGSRYSLQQAKHLLFFEIRPAIQQVHVVAMPSEQEISSFSRNGSIFVTSFVTFIDGGC